jgi:HEPN domain-containing protein
MSGPRPEPGSPADWLARARGNLALARQAKPEAAFWEDLCFHAQQAAEKALKAVLISRGVGFPRTHSVGLLLDVLPRDVVVPEALGEAAMLTDFAVTGRYPGDYPPVTEEEWADAVKHAEAVVAWAEQQIR